MAGARPRAMAVRRREQGNRAPCLRSEGACVRRRLARHGAAHRPFETDGCSGADARATTAQGRGTAVEKLSL